jgi:hypothetical protein
MSWVNPNGGTRCCINPTVKCPAARKDKRMRPAAVEDRELHIAIKW